MKKFLLFSAFFLWVFFVVGAISGDAARLVPEVPITLTEKIAQVNLKTLVESGLASDTGTLNTLINEEKTFVEVLEEKIKKQFNLDPFAKRQAVFALFERYQLHHPLFCTDVLDEGTWKELELLSGPKADVSLYLAARIDRTVTEVGRVMLYHTIIQPTCSRKELENRQHIVKTLVDDEEIFSVLEKRLRKLAVPENVLLSFWREDILSSGMQQSKFSLPFEKNSALLKAVATRVNNSEFLSMADQTFAFVRFLTTIAILGATTVSLPVGMFFERYNHRFLDDTSIGKTVKKVNNFAPRDLDLYSLTGMAQWMLGMVWGETNTFKSTVQAAICCFTAWNFLRSVRGLHEGMKIDYLIQKKLIYVATYVDVLNSISRDIKQHPKLSLLMPQIAQLDATIKTLRMQHKGFDQLLNLLSKRTFKGRPSFFSFWSRLPIVYRLIEQEKEQFNQLMVSIGQLDVYMSAARLYREKRHGRVRYCFPAYQDVSGDGHQIDINDFWHPCLNEQSVVTNSLAIRDANIIVTGPNAAGKSTIMKALTISVILAQTLGIAPAQSMTFTPFSKIATYLTIKEDLAAGNSYFKAGVMRAREVLDWVSNMPGDSVGLVVLDEVFNGTTFQEGQAAAYSFTWSLGSRKDVLTVATTHFPLMINLAQVDRRFLNYRVYVDYDLDGKIIYPYKLAPGICDQVVTFKILKEEGFADDFIARAEAILREETAKKVAL